MGSIPNTRDKELAWFTLDNQQIVSCGEGGRIFNSFFSIQKKKILKKSPPERSDYQI